MSFSFSSLQETLVASKATPSSLRAAFLAGALLAFASLFGGLVAQAQTAYQKDKPEEESRLAALQASLPKMLPLPAVPLGQQQDASEKRPAGGKQEAGRQQGTSRWQKPASRGKAGPRKAAGFENEMIPLKANAAQGARAQTEPEVAASSPSQKRRRQQERRGRPQAQRQPAAASSPDKDAEEPRRSQVQLAILKARRDYEETGDARIIREGTQLVLPYGHNQPTIRTTPMRFTLVKLNKNEFVKKPFIADPFRWDVSYGTAGTQGNYNQYISVKPRRCGLSSNMAFLTNMGRVYNMTFEASECTGNQPVGGAEQEGKDPYAVQVSFYYPDASSAQIPEPPSQAQPSRRPSPRRPPPRTLQASQFASSRSQGGGTETRPPRRRHAGAADRFASVRAGGGRARTSRRVSGLNPPVENGAVSAQMPTVNIEDLSASYAVEADDGFPCEPVAVSDDGRRMFVRYPSEDPSCRFRFPIYAAGPEGTLRLLNYKVLDGNLYVTEGVPRRAMQLYYDEDGDRHALRIRNRALTEDD